MPGFAPCQYRKEARDLEERKQLWRAAYEKCTSSSAETCIREADKAVAAYDKMVAAMEERFGCLLR